MPKTELWYFQLNREIKRMHYNKVSGAIKTALLLFMLVFVFQGNKAFSQLPGTTYFWIGEGGNWNDVSHWSSSSGGASAAAIPGQDDAVVFDENSFSFPNQEVVIDDEGSFYSMDWSGIAEEQALIFDSTLYAYGNITLNKLVSLRRNVNSVSYTHLTLPTILLV